MTNSCQRGIECNTVEPSVCFVLSCHYCTHTDIETCISKCPTCVCHPPFCLCSFDSHCFPTCSMTKCFDHFSVVFSGLPLVGLSSQVVVLIRVDQPPDNHNHISIDFIFTFTMKGRFALLSAFFGGCTLQCICIVLDCTEGRKLVLGILSQTKS